MDSGANVSVLDTNCLEFLKKNDIHFKPVKSEIFTANGSKQTVIGYCKLPILFKNVTKDLIFYLVPSLSQTAYFGINFWREFALAPAIVPSVSSVEANFLEKGDASSKFHKLSPEQHIILEKNHSGVSII